MPALMTGLKWVVNGIHQAVRILRPINGDKLRHREKLLNQSDANIEKHGTHPNGVNDGSGRRILITQTCTKPTGRLVTG